MPERNIEVRAKDRPEAERKAREIAEGPTESGRRFYTLRIVGAEALHWAEGPDGTVLWHVKLQGDEMTEAEARAMGGDR